MHTIYFQGYKLHGGMQVPRKLIINYFIASKQELLLYLIIIIITKMLISIDYVKLTLGTIRKHHGQKILYLTTKNN